MMFLQKWGAAIVAILAAVGAVFGLKYRGDRYKEKAQHEADRADQNQEIIDDVHQVNVARNDSDERERVRDKYRRD